MKRTTIRGVCIEREPYPELPYSLDHFDAAGNLIDTLDRYPDLASAREAFAAAVRHRPQRRLCLRRGARVIARHGAGRLTPPKAAPIVVQCLVQFLGQ